jgi:hypothetical protein
MSQKPEVLNRRKIHEYSVPPLKSKNPNPKTITTIDSFQSHSFKKSKEEYIQRVKSIYSPNMCEKSTQKSYRIHSRVTVLKGKLPITEITEEVSLKNPDIQLKPESKNRKPLEVTYDNQKFIIQSNKFNHLIIKQAAREGLSLAREELLRSFSLTINTSNSVSVVPSQNSGYFYYLGKGNNSELVKRVLMTRPWWTQAEDDKFPNVNFTWTQILNTKFIQTVPLAEHQKNSPAEVSEKEKLESLTLGYDLITGSASFIGLTNKTVWASSSIRLHNRLEHNFNLADKKFLYINMKRYYSAIGENVFDYLPITFHLQHGEDDQSFFNFVQVFESFKAKKMHNLWILKPGENCNRGNGICVCNSLEQIRAELKSNPFPKTGEHTFVIQKYIERPFLVNRRKFDIRLYCLVTSTNGFLQAYYYQDGYIRTSCKEYNPKVLDNKFIHLTNDAVQKKSEDYGRYEFANKMSYSEFQRYLENHRPKVFVNFFTDVIPKMKKMVQETILATFKKLDLRRRAHTFEIFGYDFLLDEHLKPWLIEVNTNPCLELSSGLLATIIPTMLENAFRIAVDPLFPPPSSGKYQPTSFYFNENALENKFELIFHEFTDGPKLIETLEARKTLQDYLS